MNTANYRSISESIRMGADQVDQVFNDTIISNLGLNFHTRTLNLHIYQLGDNENGLLNIVAERNIEVIQQSGFPHEIFTYQNKDYELITFQDTTFRDQIVSKLIVVNLGDGSYQEYDVLGTNIYPNGIIDNIVYLTYLDNMTGHPVLFDINLATRQSTFAISIPNKFNFRESYGNVVMTLMGLAVIVNTVGDTARVVTIPEKETILEIANDPKNTFLAENGVYYTYNNNIYFTDFNGVVTEIVLDNSRNVEVMGLTPEVESTNFFGDEIWVKYYVNQHDLYFYVKYRNEVGGRRNFLTKNARS